MRLVRSSDGVEVAVHDLGGDGPPLLLVHATGFCAGTLRPMASALRGSFHAWAVDVRGHGRAVTPPGVDFRWRGFADDVLAAVDGLGLVGGYAFGHSCGGAAVLDAEARLPGTFRGLYCYEPIVWPSPPAAGSRDLLIEGARRRRDTFGSRAEARANFASKRPFVTWSAEALDAYVSCGFDEAPDGSVHLRCRPEWEAAIYRQGLVHDGFDRLGWVTCPVAIGSGERWEAVGEEVVTAQAAALPRSTVETFAGLGHLGPMEDPSRVAAGVSEAFTP